MTSILKKIFGTKNSINEKQEPSVAGTIELENQAGTKLGYAPIAGIWGFITELNGYDYLETNIVTDKNIKTFNGVTLTFSGSDTSFTLKSDMNELEGEPLTDVKAYLSRISFDIDKGQMKKVQAKKYDNIVLNYKKKEIIFTKA